MKEKIKLSGTESFLMRIADHLRKNMEESEYKEYIFDLLFLKRMSDVFEEKREQVIALASVLHTDEKNYLHFGLPTK
ncbi:MAG: type I restriction-modification system subunit M N-terminal domain-containing protein [Prevotellaceae bacterium]|nr:type I restriction-modification system subunit M N-terminal domain-containing protein [Candidatus Faecinaster equi]